MVRHLRKSRGKAIYAGAGSIAFTGLARSVLTVGKDPATGARILACTKSSLCEQPTSIGYELQTSGGVAVVKWLDQVPTTADDLMDESGEISALEQACEFLGDELASGWVWGRDVKRQADDAHIAPITLRRAKIKLGVLTVRGSRLKQEVLAKRDETRWYMALPNLAADVESRG